MSTFASNDDFISLDAGFSDDEDDEQDSPDEKAKAGINDDDDEEDDFMSDKFLVEAAAATAKETKSYSQRRKEQIRKGQEKGYQRSRAEREKEAREEGLKRNLIRQEEEQNASSSIKVPSNKALDMMKKMGFKPGEGLGKQASPSASTSKSASPAPADEEDDLLPTRSGIGAKRANPLSSNGISIGMNGKGKETAVRIDPIEIQMRAGELKDGDGICDGQ